MFARFNPFEVRCACQGDGGQLPKIMGRAAVFFDPADPLTEYQLRSQIVERIPPGVFDQVLSGEDDILGLRDHDESLFLGRRSSGTLRVSLSERGLDYEIDTPNTREGLDTLELLNRRDIKGSSFSMRKARGTWSVEKRNGSALYVRTITGFDGVHDLGPVLVPAYPGTTAETMTARRSCAMVNRRHAGQPPAEMAEIEGDLQQFIRLNWMQSEAELQLRQLAFRAAM